MSVASNPANLSRPQARPSHAKRWLALVLVVGLALAGGGIWWFRPGGAAHGGHTPAGPAAADAAPVQAASPIRVDVVRPRTGGLARHTIQPGSVHAFESVDMYANVSGFLKAQSVDIGAAVKRGDLLAEIDAPELQKDVERSAAAVEQARTRAALAEARVATAEAERAAMAATVTQCEAAIAQQVAKRTLSEKQYERVRGLHAREAVPRELVDEQASDLESAQAGERSAHAAVLTAKAQVAAADAKVHQAKADVAEAKAAILFAEAQLGRAEVVNAYRRITAPFDGVITARHFHPGAFIQSAASGSSEPLLTVKRTDRMRVVIQVPDLDVALLDVGDPATIVIDALRGKTFTGTVSRLANAETPTSRTMRVEVDLENPKGVLHEGMYGRATIELRPPSKGLAVPASCVLGHTDEGEGKVYLVRDGRIVPTTVALGDDDGLMTEILKGLNPDDSVVLNPRSVNDDGSPVAANLVPAGDFPH